MLYEPLHTYRSFQRSCESENPIEVIEDFPKPQAQSIAPPEYGQSRYRCRAIGMTEPKRIKNQFVDFPRKARDQ